MYVNSNRNRKGCGYNIFGIVLNISFPNGQSESFGTRITGFVLKTRTYVTSVNNFHLKEFSTIKNIAPK